MRGVRCREGHDSSRATQEARRRPRRTDIEGGPPGTVPHAGKTYELPLSYYCSSLKERRLVNPSLLRHTYSKKCRGRNQGGVRVGQVARPHTRTA